MLKALTFITLCFVILVALSSAQDKVSDAKIKQPAPETLKKTNQRAAISSKVARSEPFDKATVEAMATQCVKFDTVTGIIEMEMFPESAPESVRGFLNLATTGAFDTTTFSRIVPGFIVQGGDLFTNQKMTPELDKRARRKLLDEPSLIKHERGIISMARSGEPNSATTNFFILVSDAHHLDGTFAAFGRVIKGMEVVDAINKMPIEGEKPLKPVRIIRATVALCPVKTNS
jgi:peptidyl-prolyl cis-trans isomerase B (cyclophilin B)